MPKQRKRPNPTQPSTVRGEVILSTTHLHATHRISCLLAAVDGVHTLSPRDETDLRLVLASSALHREQVSIGSTEQHRRMR